MHTAPSLQSASSGKRPSHGASHGGHVSPHPSLFGTLEAKGGMKKHKCGGILVIICTQICHANIAPPAILLSKLLAQQCPQVDVEWRD